MEWHCVFHHYKYCQLQHLNSTSLAELSQNYENQRLLKFHFFFLLRRSISNLVVSVQRPLCLLLFVSAKVNRCQKVQPYSSSCSCISQRLPSLIVQFEHVCIMMKVTNQLQLQIVTAYLLPGSHSLHGPPPPRIMFCIASNLKG